MKRLTAQHIRFCSTQKLVKIHLASWMLTFSFLLTGFSVNSQVTVNALNAPIERVMKEIENQTEYVFFYNSSLKNTKVTISAKNAPVENVLKSCLVNLPLTYKIVNNTIVITDVIENKVESTNQVSANQIEVRGRVTNAAGLPLEKVSVIIKGRAGGVTTDADGRFKINVEGPNDVLVFSFVGMVKKEITVNNRNVIDVVLELAEQTADEVVVTGFFKQSKSSFTGSAITITGDQLRSVAPGNFFQALSILTPGLVVTENNNLGSNPNALPEILIRGVTSFASNNPSVNQPLIVRDGTIISTQDLYDMDINEIASVTILKDASAAALYGARAANGVIVIERNRMANGKMKVIYNVISSIQFPDFSGYNILNPADKLEYERLAGLYHSEDNLQQQVLDSQYNARLMDVNRGVNTDWLAQPSRVGYSMDHSLRLNGGAGNTRYELNLRYGSVEGVMKDDFRKRYGLGFALEYHTQNGLTFTNRTSLSHVGVKYSPYGSFSSFTQMNPYERIYDQFGEFNKTFSWNLNNPMYEASLGSFSRATSQNLSNDFDVRWRLSKKFTVASHLNFTFNSGKTEMYTSPLSRVYKDFPDLSQRGSMGITNNNGFNYSGNVVVSYNQSLPAQSLLTANLGGNFNHSDFKNSSFSGIGFYADALRSINFATSYPVGSGPGGSQDLNADLGGFLNVNYLYRNRYYFDGVYQVSGSSKFGSNNRYSHFWSAGLGWNLHNEAFLKNDWLDIFKLRASTGYTGKVSFASYQALTTYRYNVNLNYLNGIGAVPITIGNPDLKWERTMNYNAGLDISFLNRRINLTADVYLRKTTDLLIDKTIAPSAGVITGKDNLGEIENRGYEIKLDGYVLKRNKLQWLVGSSITHNQNKILKISNALKARNEANNSINTGSPLPQYQEGESTTAIKVVPSAGIDPATGKEVFIKLNGDKTFVFDPADKIVVGDRLPSALGTVYSVVNYGKFSFATYFRYFYGQYIYNTTRATKVEGSDPKHNADYRVFAQRWKNPGDVTMYRDIANVSLPYQTTRFVEKENTLSLARLNLSYEFNPDLLKKMGMSKASLGISMNDLFRLSTVKIERGTDYLYSRGFDINLNVIF